MKRLLIIALLLLSFPAAAQDRPAEDDLFGGGGPIVPDEAVRDEAIFGEESPGEVKENRALLDDDRLQIGGMLYLRFMAQFNRDQSEDGDRWSTLSNPNLLDVYLDGRPNDRIRAFVRGRLSYDPVAGYPASYREGYDQAREMAEAIGEEIPGLPDRNKPVAALDQLWIKFDVARRVWLTIGKAPVRWGTTRLWNPADIVNATRRDPLDFFDQRGGVPLIKLHIPIESLGWNIYLLGLMDKAQTVEGVGGAARLEMVFSTVEVGLSATARKERDVLTALDFSAGIGDFDLTGEVGLTALTHSKGLRPGVLHDDLHLQASLGLSYGIRYGDEDTLYLGGEYFFNPDQWTDWRDYPAAFSAGLAELDGAAPYRPFYLGRHYGAVFLALPGPGSWDDVSFTATGMGNFTDMSFIARLDASITVLTYLTIQAYVQGHLGRKGGEFRFGFDEIPFTDPATAMDLSLPIAYPYQLVDAGVNLRVNF
ncbi:MAG: hypothetical protein ABIK09_11080 [Pseudomonadota bacterium]